MLLNCYKLACKVRKGVLERLCAPWASSAKTSRAAQSIRPVVTLCRADAATVPSHLSICTVRQDDSRVTRPGLGQVLRPVLLGQLLVLLLGARDNARLTCSMRHALLRRGTTV